MSSPGGAHLRRDIKYFGAAFLVLNAMIGAGIFALPGKVAVNAGMLSPWLFLAVGVVFLAVVLTFAELASYFRESGGPVLYATYAFGPLAGFGTGEIVSTDWLSLPAVVWIAVVYLGVVTSAGTFFLVQYASMRLPASKVLSYGYMIPVFIIVYEGVLGHGWASPSVLAGAVLTVVGLVVMALAPDL